MKLASDPTVYLIEKGKKRRVYSSAVYTSRFNWGELVTITSSELSRYPDGPMLGFRDGTLIRVKGTADVYLISSQKRRLIASWTVLQDLGLEQQAILDITSAELNLHAPGTRITDATQTPDGCLVKRGKPDVYLAQGDKLRPLPFWRVYQYNFPGQAIIGDAIYSIGSGYRHLIPSGDAFSAGGWSWNRVRSLQPWVFGNIPRGDGIPNIRNGSLVRPSGRSEVYAIGSGRHAVPSPITLEACGFNNGQYTPSLSAVSSIPRGADIPPVGRGDLIDSNGTKYLVFGGLRPIRTYDTFLGIAGGSRPCYSVNPSVISTIRDVGSYPNLPQPWYNTGKFPQGQCTWYVSTVRGVVWSGNACQWNENASAAGLSVGSRPVPGTIAVWEAGPRSSKWGHVAIVTAVGGGGCIKIQEYNLNNPCGYGERTINAAECSGSFIY